MLYTLKLIQNNIYCQLQLKIFFKFLKNAFPEEMLSHAIIAGLENKTKNLKHFLFKNKDTISKSRNSNKHNPIRKTKCQNKLLFPMKTAWQEYLT